MAQLHLAAPQETLDSIRQMAAKEGISVNALLVPFLNDIARGELTRVPHYPAPKPEKKAA